MPSTGYEDDGQQFETAREVYEKKNNKKLTLKVRETKDWYPRDRTYRKEDRQQARKEEKLEECWISVEEEA